MYKINKHRLISDIKSARYEGVIPKKIHYCWFGKKAKPRLAIRCINSWCKYCPDYEIIEWNEENFDVNLNGYTKWCYENQKWAFLSDYVRLWVVYQHGGVYFDTDVELIRNPDYLLKDIAFWGFETLDVGIGNRKRNGGFVNSGLGFGSVAGGLGLKEMLKEYKPLLDGKNGTIGCPILNTRALVRLELKPDGSFQRFEWGTVYPSDYFNPYDSSTGRLKKTENTVSIHWYMGSFLTRRQKMRATITKPFHRIFGVNCFEFLKRT